MQNGFYVVTLCGSTKFKSTFNEANRQLTLRGILVLSVGVFGHQKEDAILFKQPDTKQMLDQIHLAKIDMADAILVLNEEGPLGVPYIGQSTANEIDYATKQGKHIFYLSDYNHSNCYDELALKLENRMAGIFI